MKNKILNFTLSALLIITLLPIPKSSAATLQLLVSTDCSSYGAGPVSITAGDSYCYQLTYTGGAATDDLQFNLPGNTFWDSGVGGPGPAPDTTVQGVTQTLIWTNRNFVIYQFQVTTNGSVATATNLQFAADTDGDGNYDDDFSSSVTVNVTTNPTLNSATYLDSNSNGKLDKVKLIFSKGIQGTSDGTGFSIAQDACSSARTITNGAVTTTSIANDTLTFTFNECDAYDSGDKPNLTYNSGVGDINDGAGGNLATIASGDLSETDGATPVRISSSSVSVANNANITVEFSETVTIPADAATLNCSGSVPGAVSRVSSNGNNNALEFNPTSNLTQASCTLTIVSSKIVDGNSRYAVSETISITVTGLDVLAPTGDSITSGSCSNTGLCIDSGVAATKVTAVSLTIAATDDSGTVTSMYIDGDVADDANTKEWISYSTSKTVTLTSGDGVKSVSIKFKDAAANEGSVYYESITYDTNAPTTAINTGGGTYSAQQSITLTTEAGATIYSEQVAGNAACPSTASLANYTGNGTVGNIGVATPGKKLCYFSVDVAGNRESVSSEVYIVDANFPNIVIDAIADQYLATGESTTISFTATDGVGLNAANPNYWIEEGGSGVQGSGDALDSGQATSGVQEVSAAIAAANAALTEGSNTIYIYVIDTATNTGSTSFTLYKDTTDPANASISIENGASAVEGTAVDLELFATDAGSGLADMYIDGSVVDDANTKEWITYATSKTVTLSGSAGIKTVSVTYRDQAGNTVGPVSDTITYVATCSSSQHFDGSSCVSNISSCTIGNGTGRQTWAGGIWGACTVYSCNSGYVIQGNTCHIQTQSCSISNGTGEQTWSSGSWGACTPLTCNTNYQSDGTTCAPLTDGGSGGGGGGGGGLVDTTTIYTLPKTESDKAVNVFRPIQVSGNVFTRATTLENYYNHSIAEIEQGTEVFDLDGNILENVVIYQPTKITGTSALNTLGIPNPSKPLAYSRYYQFGSLKEKFSKPIKLTFPIFASVAKLDPTSILILKWVPTGLSAQSMSILLASTEEIVPPNGEWQVIGDGNLIDADYNLIINTDYSTLYAIVNAEGTVAPTTGTSQKPYGSTPFTDIGSHWAKDYIAELYLDKIVSGKTASTFAPDDKITRAELTKIALNTFEYTTEEEVTSAPFSDVPLDSWFTKFVTKAKESGVLQGYSDGTFRPNQSINRAEALKILIEAAQIDSTGFEASFADTDSNAWYATYLAYAKEKGIVEGYAIETEVAETDGTSGTGKVKDIYTFNRYLGEGNSGEDVTDLQKALQQLGYYSGTLTSDFDSNTISALMKYQLARGLILHESNFGAGYFGPKTKAVFEEENIGQVTYKTVTEYHFKPSQFITRAEIAKIALKIRELSE